MTNPSSEAGRARLGLRDLAAGDFAQACELWEPDATRRWYQHALLRLSVIDGDGYCDVCRRMRDRFRRTSNPYFATEVVRTSLLASDPNASFFENVGHVEPVSTASVFQPQRHSIDCEIP